MNSLPGRHSREANDRVLPPGVMIEGHQERLPLKLISRSLIANDLLTNLQRGRLDTAFQHLELVRLSDGRMLFDAGESIEYVYFPTTAVVSLLYVLNNGATTEVAVIGQEGMIGMWYATGERALCRAVVQMGGYAYRLKAQHLRDAVAQGGTVPQLLLCYSNALFAQVTHNAVGGRRSSVLQTLARWLLERCDRSMSCELKVTHELVASMLGVRRESITEAMGKLQEAGAVRCWRGKVTILDRLTLERSAGQRFGAQANGQSYERPVPQMT